MLENVAMLTVLVRILIFICSVPFFFIVLNLKFSIEESHLNTSKISVLLLLEIISFGITISEFKADRPEHLSYTAATIGAILSKDQIDGAEMWEAEVSSYLKINLRNSLLCIYFTIVSGLTRLNCPTFFTAWCLMKILILKENSFVNLFYRLMMKEATYSQQPSLMSLLFCVNLQKW